MVKFARFRKLKKRIWGRPYVLLWPIARAAPDANRPPGWKPAACNRWACGALRSRAKRGHCDALPSVAMTMTGRACLAVRCDMHECPSQFVGQRSIRQSNASPAGDDVKSQNGQFVQFILQKKTASLSKLSVAIRQAQCPSMVIH
jgi:hypothetical protein